MSVKVRLQRGGRKGLPFYGIVVADSRSARDKKYIEKIGFWAPKAKGNDIPFKLDEARLEHWVGVGAQVTDVVARLLVKNNVGPAKVRETFTKLKERRIKTAAYVAAGKAKGEELKAKAEAEKAAAEAAETAKAEAATAAAAAAEAKAAAEAAAAAPAPEAAAEETPAAQ